MDHGKSTLVQALTGIDPDRFQEEKQRGMTIDLGFAWLTLPSGREISIVDVPGHTRFIKNMLAGVGSIDLALVLVAANESVMPQTREHVAILDLLGISNGIIVVAKTDLADQEMLDVVDTEVHELISGTSLELSPIISVSAITGTGLSELITTVGNPRVPIDRSFSIAGFGTVVTGTLIDGPLHVGQEVEILPSGSKSRIRGLQSHQQKIDEAQPGRRIAINLSGISKENVKRGEVLTIPGWLKPSKAIDVRIRLLQNSRPLKHNHTVSFHTGSTETPALVRLLEGNEIRPGEDMLAQIRLSYPLPVTKGDYFVLRDSDSTMGGGTVIETHAKRHKRNFYPTLQILNTIENGTPEEVMKQILHTVQFINIQDISKQMNLSPDEILSISKDINVGNSVIVLESSNPSKGSLLFSPARLDDMVVKFGDLIKRYHKDNPLRNGIQKEELRSRLELGIQEFSLIMNHMLEKQVCIEDAKLLRLPGHLVSLKPEQNEIVESYTNHILSNPYSPPTDIQLDEELLAFLIREGRVVKVSASVIYDAHIFDNISDTIISKIKESGKINVAQVRDTFQTSRKYALALLEYMDQQRITRRIGDDRILR